MKFSILVIFLKWVLLFTNLVNIASPTYTEPTIFQKLLYNSCSGEMAVTNEEKFKRKNGHLLSFTSRL